jgi:CRISPR-associated endonuclease/helicase Cas3
MKSISSNDFAQFFQELHHHAPYSWQTRLAQRAVEGNWPGAIDLPTGSGKTACIDAAVFALACQAGKDVRSRSAPRRVFFCVNRRIIVDEAYDRAKNIAERLWKAERGEGEEAPVLAAAAAALRQIAGTSKEDDVPPLDVLELRGGIYRDNRWARSAVQPTVICTTIDQLGSRLLFRGHGVSENAAPIQAALVAYDSLVLLDEAHISKPFLESLESVQRYLDPEKWAREAIGVRRMTVVPMTATPPSTVAAENVIRLDAGDRKNESLDRRLTASKRAILYRVTDMPGSIVEQAGRQAEAGCFAIGIIVNRVASARAIYEQLCANHPGAAIELVIGAMRPIDRDSQADRLASRVGKKRPDATVETSFTIATQCLEVGADYDFDVLLTECASLDALRQRFGRLNRSGRKIEARAVIFVKDKDLKPEPLDEAKPLDPIYGNALARTWTWLWEHANEESPPEASNNGKEKSNPSKHKLKAVPESHTIDFGIDAFNALLCKHAEDGRIPKSLLAPSAALNAPVMLPAYLDIWCQTWPIPVPDPDVSLFIHGLQQVEPDVQVCWRGDLQEGEDGKRSDWCDIVALVPPSSAECMRVPISQARRWLANSANGQPDLGDLLGVPGPGDESRDRSANGEKRTPPIAGVLWRGSDSKLVTSPDELRPGDTLVLPVSNGGWNELGHIPATEVESQEGPAESEENASASLEIAGTPETASLETGSVIDVAEAAYELVRDRRVLRVHTSRVDSSADRALIQALIDRLLDDQVRPGRQEIQDLLRETAGSLSERNAAFRDKLHYFAGKRQRFSSEPYPDRRGFVLIAKTRMSSEKAWFLPPLDEGDDESSRIQRVESVSLADHTGHVVEAIERALGCLHTSVNPSAYLIAAERHDWGKTDDRFQAILRRADRTEAWLFAGGEPLFLAKSARLAQTARERLAARERSQLPGGFRHEMVSVQLVEKAGFPPSLAADRDLVLHLIAAHHGYGRPFAPVVLDDEPPEVLYQGIALTTAERLVRPPHRLDSGIADRFWTLTRRYGWWGLAYLEALLRLADQQASAEEDAGKCDTRHSPEPLEINP